MSSVFCYPVGLPGWRLAVKLGAPIKTNVLVAFDAEKKRFSALCVDFDRKNPLATDAETVESLQGKLEEAFAGAIEKALGKRPLMPAHLSVDMHLVARLPVTEGKAAEHAASADAPMLPRCCSARQFMKNEEKA